MPAHDRRGAHADVNIRRAILLAEPKIIVQLLERAVGVEHRLEVSIRRQRDGLTGHFHRRRCHRRFRGRLSRSLSSGFVVQPGDLFETKPTLLFEKIGDRQRRVGLMCGEGGGNLLVVQLGHTRCRLHNVRGRLFLQPVHMLDVEPALLEHKVGDIEPRVLAQRLHHHVDLLGVDPPQTDGSSKIMCFHVRTLGLQVAPFPNSLQAPGAFTTLSAC